MASGAGVRKARQPPTSNRGCESWGTACVHRLPRLRSLSSTPCRWGGCSTERLGKPPRSHSSRGAELGGLRQCHSGLHSPSQVRTFPITGPGTGEPGWLALEAVFGAGMVRNQVCMTMCMPDLGWGRAPEGRADNACPRCLLRRGVCVLGATPPPLT